MMDVRFLTLAETEIDDAVSWFQEQSENQSLNFLDELDRAVRLVAAFPLIAAEITHFHREPGYWADRFKSTENP